MEVSGGELYFLGAIQNIEISYRLTKDGLLDYAFKYPNSDVIYSGYITDYFSKSDKNSADVSLEKIISAKGELGSIERLVNNQNLQAQTILAPETRYDENGMQRGSTTVSTIKQSMRAFYGSEYSNKAVTSGVRTFSHRGKNITASIFIREDLIFDVYAPVPWAFLTGTALSVICLYLGLPLEKVKDIVSWVLTAGGILVSVSSLTVKEWKTRAEYIRHRTIAGLYGGELEKVRHGWAYEGDAGYTTNFVSHNPDPTNWTNYNWQMDQAVTFYKLHY